MECRIYNHKKYYAVAHHNTKAEAEASAKRVRSYGKETVRVTKEKDGNRYIYTVWAHTK